MPLYFYKFFKLKDGKHKETVRNKLSRENDKHHDGSIYLII